MVEYDDALVFAAIGDKPTTLYRIFHFTDWKDKYVPSYERMNQAISLLMHNGLIEYTPTGYRRLPAAKERFPGLDDITWDGLKALMKAMQEADLKDPGNQMVVPKKDYDLADKQYEMTAKLIVPALIVIVPYLVAKSLVDKLRGKSDQ